MFSVHWYVQKKCALHKSVGVCTQYLIYFSFNQLLSLSVICDKNYVILGNKNTLNIIVIAIIIVNLDHNTVIYGLFI